MEDLSKSPWPFFSCHVGFKNIMFIGFLSMNFLQVSDVYKSVLKRGPGHLDRGRRNPRRLLKKSRDSGHSQAPPEITRLGFLVFVFCNMVLYHLEIIIQTADRQILERQILVCYFRATTDGWSYPITPGWGWLRTGGGFG